MVLARSSMDVLRFIWNTEMRALVGISCNEPGPLQPLPCCVTPKTSLVEMIQPHSSPVQTFPSLGNIYFQLLLLGNYYFTSCLGLCYDCEAKALNSACENLQWWFKKHLKCSLVLSQSLGITSGLSDVGVKGKMEITQQGLVLCYALGVQSEFGSSGFYSCCRDYLLGFLNKKAKDF